MNTYMTHPGQHLTDEDLLCMIDGEGDDSWRTDREAHIDTCAECALALQALDADGDIIRDWLEHAAFEDGDDNAPRAMPHSAPHAIPQSAPRAMPRSAPRPVPAWLKAAAVVALLAAPVAALPGVRAWVGDVLDGAPEADVAATAAPAAPAASRTAAAIRFVPDPGAFVVNVDAVQSAGELFIGRGADAEAMLEQTASGDDAPLAARPAGAAGDAAGPVIASASLRIRNTAVDRAGYVLHVPAGVTRVTVRVAGTVVAVLDGAAIDTGTIIRLHTP